MTKQHKNELFPAAMDTEGHLVRDILKQNEFLLRRHLVLSKTVLEHLKAGGLITEIGRRKIMLEPSHRQIGVLIRIMEYKGLHSMKKFLDILRQTGHGFLVDNILDTNVSAAQMNVASASDDLRYRDGHRRSQTSGLTGGRGGFDYRCVNRRGYDFSDPVPRKSVTAGMASYFDTDNSLASLMRGREARDNPEVNSRGIFNTRSLLADPHIPGAAPLYNGLGHHHAAEMVQTRSKDTIPGTLYGLNQAFADQDQQNHHAMNVLRQEETAIRQLLEQNTRDQNQVRRKQTVVHDIVDRLRDIHVRANEVYEPSPNPNIGRYRLSQLNKIPWSIDR